MSISSLCHSFCSVAISEFCCWIFDSNPLTFDSRRTTLASKTSLISTCDWNFQNKISGKLTIFWKMEMDVFSRNFSTVVSLILLRTDRWPSSSKAKTANTNGRWRTSDVPLFGVEMRQSRMGKKCILSGMTTAKHPCTLYLDTSIRTLTSLDGKEGGNVGDTQFTLGLTESKLSPVSRGMDVQSSWEAARTSVVASLASCSSLFFCGNSHCFLAFFFQDLFFSPFDAPPPPPSPPPQSIHHLVSKVLL